MKLTNVKGNTWAIEGPQLVALYQIDDTHCVLIDPGSFKLLPSIEEALGELGLIPVGVICTHMHYDHHETSQYFRTAYGAQLALPQLEADIVRSEESLKNHLYIFTMDLIRTYPRLQNLIGPVDRVITRDEDTIQFCGAEFTIVHTPGHSPDHICVITPDNVCCAGDSLMTDEVLEGAMIPFAFDLSLDIESKKKMMTLDCDASILCHCGVVYGPLEELGQRNLDRVYQQLTAYADLITRPMTYSEVYQVVIRGMKLSVGHPIRAQYLERYLRPYLEYLVDTGALELIELDGAPAVRPRERNHED